MRKFRVFIAPSATEQINDQRLFIAQDSFDNAIAWEQRLLRGIRSIGDSPGHAVDELASSHHGKTLRKYIFEGTYLIHYWVDDSAGIVNVISFRHGARLPRRGEP